MKTKIAVIITFVIALLTPVAVQAQKWSALTSTNSALGSDYTAIVANGGSYSITWTNLANPLWLALALKAPLISPAFTTPKLGAATGTSLDITNSIKAQNITVSRAVINGADGLLTNSVTTAAELVFVNGVTSALQTQIDAKAALASPTFTGNPLVPNQALSDSDTSAANTAFVKSNISAIVSSPMVGTVSNAVAVSGLLAVDATKTNGISATLAHLTNTFGLTGDTTKFINGAGVLSTPSGSGANWVGSGSTNSLLAGQAAVNNLVVTNAITGGSLVLNGTSTNTVSDFNVTNVLNAGSITVVTNLTVGATNVISSLGGKADLASPVLTGNPTVPNQALSDSDTSIANTAFVTSNLTVSVTYARVTNALSLTGSTATFLRSDGSQATPAGAGTVVGPVSSTDNAIARYDLTTGTIIQNSVVLVGDSGIVTGVNSITSTNAVTASDFTAGSTNMVTALNLKAPLASPTFTGDPQAPNVVLSDSDTTIANTAFVTSNITATATSTQVYQNKTFDAAATGNVLKQTKYINLQRPDYGDGAGAVPQTNSYVASGLMHYTLSGNAETNANFIVYEFDCPPDLDTSVEMTATFSFLSGGTDTDDYVFHFTYGQVAAGTAYPTGTGISSLPIVMTVNTVTEANGDIQQSAATTLTGWAAALTPGVPMCVRVARLQNAQDDGARDVSLRIAYGSTQ